MDGFSGYNQTRIRSQDQYKIAFTTSRGHSRITSCHLDSIMLEPHSSEPCLTVSMTWFIFSLETSTTSLLS
uniref:Uncharacterized protein n=1 Tax=Picea glauca TaxID=3330 RepID=A0A101M3J0_PICGL|nr:hypothetical protein ABT39_MTgene244 [Picea glauca]